MESFTLNVRRPWIISAFGRNPLVRRSDRFEALLTVFLVVAALLAVPVAGAIATAVHDSRSEVYAEQSASRHLVTATVIADRTVNFEYARVVTTAPTRWRDGGVEHVETLFVEPAAKVGDRVDIWVDRSGNHVAAPTGSWHAGLDAVVAGVGAWLGFLVIAVGSWVLVRAWLARTRARGWDHGLQLMVDDNGGRTGRQS